MRKRDRLRAEDKMVQRERQMEGEEFADKDAFVTPAYLAQQEELRRIEEEEKKKEGELAPFPSARRSLTPLVEAQAGKPGGMAAFYKSYLDTTSAAHDAAVAASLTKKPILGPTFNVAPPPTIQSEAQIAAEHAAKTGQQVEVNDEGIIIDKRQLMTGGLNLVSKPKAGPSGAAGGFAAPIAARAASSSTSTSTTDPLVNPTGLSAAERARQSRERHSREIERQMVELESRRKREAEEQLQQKVQKVAKRNDETRVEKLKREAEERRVKREAEAKAEKEAGGV